MRRIRSDCCARVANGHAAAAPPESVMNSRRLKLDPQFWRIVTAQIARLEGANDVRFGSKADMCSAKSHVR